MTSKEPGQALAEGSITDLDISFEDDPKVVKAASTEDYTVHVVPQTWRSGKLSLSMAWGALLSSMFWLFIGAITAASVGTTNAIIGLTLSALCAGGLSYVITRYSIRTGLTVALFSRRIFGFRGSIIVPLLFGATALYFAVFESAVLSHGLHGYFGGSLQIWYLAVAIIGMPLVIGGIRVWLDKFNGILLPFYLVGVVVLIVWTAKDYEVNMILPDMGLNFAAPGWFWVFSLYMGVFLMLMYVMDFSRFGKPKDVRFHSMVTFGPVFYLITYVGFGLVGIMLVGSVPSLTASGALSESAVVDAMIQVMGLTGVVVLVISQARCNTSNMYMASTNIEAFISRVARIKVPRIASVVLCGLIIYLLLLTDVLSWLTIALNWQGTFIVAWAGIALTYIAMNYRSESIPEFRPGRLRPLTPALGVWLAVSLIGVLLLEFGGAFGTTWSAPIVFVLSIIGGLLTWRFPAVLKRAHDPRDEVEDVWEARIRCHECDRSYVAVEMDRDPSANHAAICSECASESSTFYKAALVEARATRN